MNVINKRSLMNKLKDKINDHRVNSGRKKMSLETKKIAYQFWHDNCTVSTITTKHARLRKSAIPPIQKDLEFHLCKK